MTSASPHFASVCWVIVLPEPNGPGMAARPRLPPRPPVHHLPLGPVAQAAHRLRHGELPALDLRHLPALDGWRDEDLVLEVELLHPADGVAGPDLVSGFCGRLDGPRLLPARGR